MARITTSILIMLILLNGTMSIMEATGMNDDLGIRIQTGVDKEIENAIDDAENGFDSEVGIIESFISLSLAAVRSVKAFIATIFLAPTMFSQLLGGGETIDKIVGALFAPVYIFSLFELIFIASGRDLNT